MESVLFLVMSEIRSYTPNRRNEVINTKASRVKKTEFIGKKRFQNAE
jgi:hypothetical protein